MSSSSSHSPTVTYCGVSFPYGKFDYGRFNGDVTKHSTGWHKRDIVHVKPKTFVATAFGEAKSNTLAGEGILLVSMTMEEYRKDLTTSHAVSIFWTIWCVVTILALVGFYAIPNDWLED